MAPAMSNMAGHLCSSTTIGVKQEDLQRLATAWDISDEHGAKSCLSHTYVLFEAHALSAAACPLLDDYYSARVFMTIARPCACVHKCPLNNQGCAYQG